MLNRYPLWKNLLIFFVMILGVLYAAPNLYPDDYAIQVSGSRNIYKTDQALISRIEKALKREKIEFKATELTEKSALIRFADGEIQLKAKQAISDLLGDEYIVALNLAPTTPQWLDDIGAGPMKLGLDLRGGVHFFT